MYLKLVYANISCLKVLNGKNLFSSNCKNQSDFILLPNLIMYHILLNTILQGKLYVLDNSSYMVVNCKQHQYEPITCTEYADIFTLKH